MNLHNNWKRSLLLGCLLSWGCGFIGLFGFGVLYLSQNQVSSCVTQRNAPLPQPAAAISVQNLDKLERLDQCGV